MEITRGAELSDSALEGVAGGGVNTVSKDYTYSPIGPATTGPSAGPASGDLRADGKTKKDELVDGLIADNGIKGLLVAAGTYELYIADYAEYTRKYNAWDDRKRMLGATGVYAGPAPIPPNPYDYL